MTGPRREIDDVRCARRIGRQRVLEACAEQVGVLNEHAVAVICPSDGRLALGHLVARLNKRPTSGWNGHRVSAQPDSPRYPLCIDRPPGAAGKS